MKGRRISTRMLFTLLGCCALFFPAAADGAVFTVSRGDDPAPNGCNSGVDCSLREAFIAADSNTEDNEIVVTQDVVLARSGAGEDAGATGDLDMFSENGQDLTVRSDVAGVRRTINAGGLDRAIHQLVGNLTLKDLRITGGNATGAGASGGGVDYFAFNAGETLRLDNVQVDGNTASSAGSAAEGGGFRAGGIGPVVQVVNGSSIDGNTAGGTADNAGGNGGGMSVVGQDASLTITDSSIADNKASAGPHIGLTGGRGGGVYFQPMNTIADNAPLTITNSSITGNRVGGLGSDGSGHNGGGIHLDDGFTMAVPVLTITGSSITGNAAGGGSGNAGGTGGGIGTDFDGGSITLTGVNLSNNRAGGSDGAADGTGTGVGAGIATDLPLTISDSTVNSNRTGVATSGSVEGLGGAIRAGGAGAVTISGTTFDQNLAGTNDGGGGSHGGALNLVNQGPVSITNSRITNNVARTIGGGIQRFRDPATGAADSIVRSTIAGNQSQLSGGGIEVETEGSMTIDSSTLSGNSVGGVLSFGGGVAVAGTTTGGAQEGNLHLVNSTVSGNSVVGGGINFGGGGVNVGFFGAANLFVEESTIAGNSVSDPSSSGGNVGAINTGTDLSFRSSIVAEGVAPAGENCSYRLGAAGTPFGGNVEDRNQCMLNPAGGDLISTDPLLGPHQDNGGSTETRALPIGSPAINAGLCLGAPSDQRGYPRPGLGGSGCDSGAYELSLCNGSPLNQPGPFAGCPPPTSGGGGTTQPATTSTIFDRCAPIRKKLKKAKQAHKTAKVRKLKKKLRRCLAG